MTRKRTKSKVTDDRPVSPVWGLFTLCGAALMLLSLLSFSYAHPAHNWIGIAGFTIGQIFHSLFGIGSYLICTFLAWIGWRWLFVHSTNHLWVKSFYVLIAVASLSMLLSLIEDSFSTLSSFLGNAFYPNMWQRKMRYHLGGAPFYYLYHDMPSVNLLRVLNAAGVALIFSTTFAASVLFLAKVTPAALLRGIVSLLKRFQRTEEPEPLAEAAGSSARYVKVQIPRKEATDQHTNYQELLAIQPDTQLTVRPSLSQKEHNDRTRGAPEQPPEPPPAPKERKRQAALEAQKVHNGDFTGYKIPPLNLLTNAKKVDQSSLKQDLRRKAEVLEETLLSFGIEAKVGQINCGPTITSFEVHPSIGVKVQKIKALENDIALNMEAKSIRIIAPIPGKAAVGIEVPNAQPQEVAFKDMIAAYQQGSKKFHIPILLGKAVNGEYVMSDLTKMPHCIIAGATGSGKSVCINTIVMSVLLNLKPDEIKLILVDPKKSGTDTLHATATYASACDY